MISLDWDPGLSRQDHPVRPNYSLSARAGEQRLLVGISDHHLVSSHPEPGFFWITNIILLPQKVASPPTKQEVRVNVLVFVVDVDREVSIRHQSQGNSADWWYSGQLTENNLVTNSNVADKTRRAGWYVMAKVRLMYVIYFHAWNIKKQ